MCLLIYSFKGSRKNGNKSMYGDQGLLSFQINPRSFKWHLYYEWEMPALHPQQFLGHAECRFTRPWLLSDRCLSLQGERAAGLLVGDRLWCLRPCCSGHNCNAGLQSAFRNIIIRLAYGEGCKRQLRLLIAQKCGGLWYGFCLRSAKVRWSWETGFWMMSSQKNDYKTGY